MMNQIFISYSLEDIIVHREVVELISGIRKLNIGYHEYYQEHGFSNSYNTLKDNVVQAINQCKVFVCYVNYRNPNVMFELGYAVGKNKKIILVGDNLDLPFDLRNMALYNLQNSVFDILIEIEKYITRSVDEYTLYNMNPNELLKELNERPELLDSISPQDFEKKVFELFIEKGYHVEFPHGLQDGGYDLLIHNYKDRDAVVEVKKYKITSQVSISVARQLIGTMSLMNVQKGIIVSTAPFSESLKHFVREIEYDIELISLKELLVI